MSTFGVLPMGAPSTSTFETGSEFAFSMPEPSADAEFEAYLRASLATLVLEGAQPAAFERLLVQLAALMSGQGRADAIAVAKAAEPADAAHVVHDPKDPVGLAPGAKVTVAGDDNPRDRIAGTLVAAGLDRIVIAREDPRVGNVHVHFPRVGFTAAPA